jgi:glycosyltransferase involved in cell wall biosynthesis
MVEMLNNPLCKVLAIGPWSKNDMLSLGIRGDQIWNWGYFVENGERGMGNGERREDGALRVLWVGRLLKLKRVDTIIRAVGELSRAHTASQRLTTNNYPLTTTLDIYGAGPEEAKLRRLAKGHEDIVRFHQPVAIGEVRKLMREHDVYVMASDENEGWGAVVNEALEEGMRVLGTFEAGASAAMLPEERLFHAGDWRGLADLIVKESGGELPACSIGDWTAAKTAERLVSRR